MVLCSPVRTAIGTFGGSLNEVLAAAWGAAALQASLALAGLTSERVEGVVMGQFLQAGAELNPARQAALGAGLPVSVPAMTVERVCGSGAQTIASAAQEVWLGLSRCALAGGMENMDQAPYLLRCARIDPSDQVLAGLAAVSFWQRNQLWPIPGPEARPERCPLAERGSTRVQWDGRGNPCPPLLHTQGYRLDERLRTRRAFFVGSLGEWSLAEVWHSAGYATLRERLATLDFAPCTVCNSCELTDDNTQDGFGTKTPACGGSVWAQGFLQCP